MYAGFTGVHERQLDPKGRLALPAGFRSRLEPRCYLTFGENKCIDVLTAEEFERVASDAVEKVRRGDLERNSLRALAHNTFEVTVDAQGRVNLEERLRQYAELALGSKVIVAGAYDRVEIWDPARRDRNIGVGTADIAKEDR